jgi:SAM-dependent methyltransferase
VRAWTRLYRTSIGLGVRGLSRPGLRRQAAARIVVPLDPSRYLELPWALEALDARPGQRVLDLASPKLLAVELARRGVEVTSVDELEREVEIWRRLTAREPRLRFEVADGLALPYEEGSFRHAYSLSVLEHIAEDGDAQALRELARVVRPGGRVAITMPFAQSYREEWRDRPAFVDHGDVGGRYFFQRWYDEERVDRLVEAAPALELVSREVVRMRPNWNDAYVRMFPWLVPLGPFFGVLGREAPGPGGDVARLLFVRRQAGTD